MEEIYYLRLQLKVYISSLLRRSLMPLKPIYYRVTTLLSCMLLFFVSAATSQNINNASSFAVKSYKILPDAGYSFKRIHRDTSLKFGTDSILHTSVSNVYWIKVTLYNPYPNNENYIITLSGPIDYTLYYLSPGKQHWLSRRVGLLAANGRRLPSTVPYTLTHNRVNTFYIKANLLKSEDSYTISPNITLEKEVSYKAGETIFNVTYLISCIALLSFLFYNLYIYFHLKDKVYLYYVYTQLGALMYLAGTGRYFNVFLPLRPFNYEVKADGWINYFGLNNFFIHLGVSFIFWGFAQFTRSYLNTKKLLPEFDRALKLLANTYVIVEAIPTLITISGLRYVEFILIDNIFVLSIIGLCIISGMVAYNKQIKTARHFLVAILLPAVFAAMQSAYIIMYNATSLLPVIAILSQVLTFAVALVARVQLINEDLHIKAMQAVKLEASKTITEQLRVIAEKEKQLEKEKNESLQLRLDAKQRELVGNSVYIHQKNKLLADLKTQVKDITIQYPDADRSTLLSIQSSIKDSEYLDDEWDKFKLHFEEMHPSFFANLKASHPKLTKHELRLCAYFHINMSTKEIAAMLNIAPSSVRQAKARLNKKMTS